MDTIKSLGELSMGSRLKRLSDQCMRNIQLAYNQHHIDFDPYLFPAFHHIAKLGSTTTKELFESLKTSQPAVTQTVNKLLKKRLIETSTDAEDKRKKTITLSEKGKDFHTQVRPVWRGMERAVKKFTQHPADSLIEHLNNFEAVLQSGEFLNTVNEYIDIEMQIQIINYQEQYKQDFYDLNIEWVQKHFFVEDLDREVLSKPHQYILDPGGYIFFAVENGKALGTVALMKAEDNFFELTKMAVHPDARGRKIGQQLMQYCLDFAKEHDFDLLLYSNTVLENAIHIYRKYGFEEVPVEPDSPYVRSNIKMVWHR
ncbi:MAG: bifunctional helix-turn-helix transcriptional regulator/GNAT family N-acetyltransferase [Flavobacteriaceae bacterium]|nr:bifunctional helix-turn-helix transcriptional regulator/GNAT family N-acetyltransferase [Flavobacteriaceae bacterium]